MTEYSATIHSTIPARVLLEGAQELIGQEKLRQIIDSMAPLGEIEGGFITNSQWAELNAAEMLSFFAIQPCFFLRALEQQYGTLGGRGLALRIGRSVFQNSLKQNAALAGLRSINYRLQPAPLRLDVGLCMLAELVTEQWGDPTVVTDQGTHWEWRSDGCDGHQKNFSESPNCYLIVGFIQEFMNWSSGGRFYRVTETLCRTTGSHTCVFRIDKQSLD